MKRMISTKAAETAEGIKDFVKQNGKTTEFGGNVEIDGNLKVNGSAPGALYVYKVKGSVSGGEVSFLWICATDNMTVSDMVSELAYKLSSGSGFGMGIPASLEESGSFRNCIVANGGSTAYFDNAENELTLTDVYKIY